MKEYQKKNEEAIELYKTGISLRMDSDLKEKSFWKIVLYYKYRQDWNNLQIYSNKFLKFKKFSEVEKLRNLAEENLKNAAPAEHTFVVSGISKMNEENFDEARKDFNSALKINSEYTPALWNLGLLEMKEDLIPEAAGYFRRLIELKPEEWEYRYKLAICLYRLGQYDLSLEELKKARQFNTDPGKRFHHYINLSEGLVYLELNELNQAENKLKKSLSYRKTGFALGAMSRCLMMKKNYTEAKHFSQKALQSDSRQKDALITAALTSHLENSSEKSYRYSADYFSSIQNEKYYNIPENGKRVLLIYFSNSIIKNKISPDLEFILEHIDDKTADEILDSKPKLQIPKEDTPDRSDREYTSDDFFFFKGIFFYRNRKKDQAVAYLSRVKNRGLAYYLIAKINISNNSAKETIQLLKKAIDTESMIQFLIISDKIFIDLAEENQEFSGFYQSIKSETR